MEKSQLFEVVDEMVEKMGAEQTLEAICHSLGTDILEEHLRFIDRCYETHLF